MDNLDAKLAEVGERQEQLGESQKKMGAKLAVMGERQEQQGAKLSDVQNTVSGLLTRPMDPWDSISHRTTESERENFKTVLEKAYGPARCMVTGVQRNVAAAHIWPASARDSKRLDMFKLKADDIMSWRNGIFLLKELERRFDEKRIGFQFDISNDQFIFRVLDGSLRNTSVSRSLQNASGSESSKPITYEKLDGKPLIIENGNMPYRRLLVWHYAACRAEANHRNWIAVCEDLPSVPEPTGMDRVLSWLAKSPGVIWPDVGVLEHRGSARAASYLQSESADSCRDQSSARSGGGEAVVSGWAAGNDGEDDIQRTNER